MEDMTFKSTNTLLTLVPLIPLNQFLVILYTHVKDVFLYFNPSIPMLIVFRDGR